jgi:hypothetical protein
MTNNRARPAPVRAGATATNLILAEDTELLQKLTLRRKGNHERIVIEGLPTIRATNMCVASWTNNTANVRIVISRNWVT